MIVTLPKPGDEGYDKAQRLSRRRPRATRRGQTIVAVAYHAPIAHILKLPCIYFNPRPKWHGYPLVHERNVLDVLAHETVHCVVQRLLGYDKVAQDGIDTVFPRLGDL